LQYPFAEKPHYAGMLIAWLGRDCHGGDFVTPTTETLS